MKGSDSCALFSGVNRFPSRKSENIQFHECQELNSASRINVIWLGYKLVIVIFEETLKF